MQTGSGKKKGYNSLFLEPTNLWACFPGCSIQQLRHLQVRFSFWIWSRVLSGYRVLGHSETWHERRQFGIWSASQGNQSLLKLFHKFIFTVSLSVKWSLHEAETVYEDGVTESRKLSIACPGQVVERDINLYTWISALYCFSFSLSLSFFDWFAIAGLETWQCGRNFQRKKKKIKEICRCKTI